MRLVIFGAPGTGKGTQAIIIADALKLRHLSTGEIFREQYDKKTKSGLEVYEKYLNNGELVPDNITIEVLGNTMNGMNDNIILDGIPRTLNQANMLKYIFEPDFVIVLEVPFEALKLRLLKRAKIDNRNDDSPKVIENRFKI